VALLTQVLEQCARFYARNLSVKSEKSTDLLLRLENLLERYYRDGRLLSLGQPTVRYCAQELFLSPGYFGDLIRQQTGDSATAYLRCFAMRRAQEMLASGSTVTETAEALGFDYAQHFSRAFKRHFGFSPSKFLKNR
jgi:AraC-like DNA-binding protein